MDFGGDWSNLPMELVGDIAGRLTVFEDVNAFKGVCRGWRSAATGGKTAVSKVPLLMLAERKGRPKREFYSLARRKVYTRPIPGTKGKRCIDVGLGWILTLDNSGETCLVKPFSTLRIRLPKFTQFPRYLAMCPRVVFVTRAFLTADPSETSDFMLFMVTTQQPTQRLGVWRNGDDKWNEMESGSQHLVYDKRKLYGMVMDDEPCVEIWDPHGTDLSRPLKTVEVKNAPTFDCDKLENYLVKSTDGELLLITRINTGSGDYASARDTGTDYFDVMRVDLVKGKCIEIRDLGKDAIFIGDNVSVSVDATEFPGVLKPNCIYFTDDRLHVISRCGKGCGKDMGIYNVADQSIERFGIGSFSRTCPPPIWIFPSF